MNRGTTVTRAASAVILVAALACSGGSPTEPLADDSSISRTVTFAGSLVNTVTVTPANPRPGSTIEVVSTLLNASDTPAALLSRVCGLDVEANLNIGPPPGGGSCGGYALGGEIAARNVRTEYLKLVVSSPPGRYSLRVRHAIDPSAWVELPIEIR